MAFKRNFRPKNMARTPPYTNMASTPRDWIYEDMCIIKIFRGGQGWWHLQNPLPPTNNFCLYPPPVLRCFWKDPLMTLHPHHPTSSILHCYPLPIHNPSPPLKNFWNQTGPESGPKLDMFFCPHENRTVRYRTASVHTRTDRHDIVSFQFLDLFWNGPLDFFPYPCERNPYPYHFLERTEVELYDIVPVWTGPKTPLCIGERKNNPQPNTGIFGQK